MAFQNAIAAGGGLSHEAFWKAGFFPGGIPGAGGGGPLGGGPPGGLGGGPPGGLGGGPMGPPGGLGGPFGPFGL